MSAITFLIFAAVYLTVAAFTVASPVVCGFFLLCSGASALKAFAPGVTTARRSSVSLSHR